MQLLIIFISFFNICVSYNILAIFPYNGRSHHIFFSSIVEELATRGHEVTVVNYHPVKKMPNLHQISLEDSNSSDFVDIENHLQNIPHWFKEFHFSYDTAQAFKYIANSNCEKLMNNKYVQDMAKSTKFDVVIVEQFVTDCGLALAHKVDAPIVGMAAHILMPWTYSRLGATNHPAFVPNHFLGTGTMPDLIAKLKSILINLFFDVYYFYIIQRSDYEIVKRVYPETPDLEELGNNISLILLNQYFPLTGSRLYGPNVIEVGGMHIKSTNDLLDKDLENFLNTAENGVVYISFGTVAKNLPSGAIKEIIAFVEKSKMRFLWKVDDVNMKVPSNTILRNWLPQPAILCHPKVVAFVTHSGMLSSAEAMHCGVPLVSVPMFGDQFANSAAIVENGLGVSIDLASMTAEILEHAVLTVLQGRYQKRAKELSEVWRHRPLSPMDTAVFWIEYVAKFKGTVNMKPPSVTLPFYKYFLIDVILIVTLIAFGVLTVLYATVKLLRRLKTIVKRSNNKQKKQKLK